MGVPPEVTLGLVAPDLAAAAGVPVLPPDVIREEASRGRQSRRLSSSVWVSQRTSETMVEACGDQQRGCRRARLAVA